MNIQIFGTKKCKETQKAERYFKERRIPFHFRDLTEKGLAKGELDNISRVIPIDDWSTEKAKDLKTVECSLWFLILKKNYCQIHCYLKSQL